jgi:hypothetical protein
LEIPGKLILKTLKIYCIDLLCFNHHGTEALSQIGGDKNVANK